MAIQEEIYGDNDANVGAIDLPTGLTVEWGIVALGAGGTAPDNTVAIDSIHADVSGTMAETGTKPAWMVAKGYPDSSTGRYYDDVLEGSAITARLLPAYKDETVALLVKVGQDVRVYGTTTVRDGKLVT
jgi:hypothetical protein